MRLVAGVLRLLPLSRSLSELLRRTVARKRRRVRTKGCSDTVAVVLIDWGRYPIVRSKTFLPDRPPIQCGLLPILQGMASHPAGVRFFVLLVVNEPLELRVYEDLAASFPFVKTLLRRDNVGMGHGAYAAGYEYLRQEGYVGEVAFMNTSCVGPNSAGWLLKYQELFRSRPDIGLCGVTLNSHDTDRTQQFMPHVQSYFVYTNTDIMDFVVASEGVFPGANIVTGVGDVVVGGEIRLSQAVLDAGYAITCAHPAFRKYCFRKSRWPILDDLAWPCPRYDVRFQLEFEGSRNVI